MTPLQQMNFDQWWFHGYINNPPKAGVFMDLPAGGTFHGEVHCTKAFTSAMGRYVGQDIMGCNTPGGDGKGGALHTTDTWGIPASQTKDVKGCGLAIAYKSDPHAIKPEDFTVISTNDKCPWRRSVDFQIPKDLPACPPGGCHCLWGWIHAPDAGTEQMYQLMYRCQVTGATGTRALPAPQVARKCPTDKSNCTVGAKQPHYWLQNERNNNYQHWTDAPYYNSDYGFSNGAQTDLWATAPKPAVSSAAASSAKPVVSSAKPAATSSKAAAAAPSVDYLNTPMQITNQAPPKRDVEDAEEEEQQIERRRVPPQARRAMEAL